MAPQQPQSEWDYQWRRLQDQEEWLFWDWVAPNKPESFDGKTVLDAGCGPGHHARCVARHAKRVVAVDFNTAALARERLADLKNVEVKEGDIARFAPDELFDVVYCVGVAHHTADPDATVAHLRGLVKPGGRLILWVYAREGNALNRWLLEPAKSVLIGHLPRGAVLALSHLLTALLYPIVHTVYRLPLGFLPFYEYFANFRKLSYKRNQLNVFDKLNAPTTHFISRKQAEAWMNGLKDVHIAPYVGVSWQVSGTKPA
ncbi:MAG: methyltransferase domain-containing protein [Elusimicrobia bacterium]|nr:methyltransferase domain-containing protein [Elusimicrobiota bacterium]